MQGATILDSLTSAYHPSLSCHNVNLARNSKKLKNGSIQHNLTENYERSRANYSHEKKEV